RPAATRSTADRSDPHAAHAPYRLALSSALGERALGAALVCARKRALCLCAIRCFECRLAARPRIIPFARRAVGQPAPTGAGVVLRIRGVCAAARNLRRLCSAKRIVRALERTCRASRAAIAQAASALARAFRGPERTAISGYQLHHRRRRTDAVFVG